MDDLTNEEIVLAGLGNIDPITEDMYLDEDSEDLGRRGRRMRHPRHNFKSAVKNEIGASRFRRHFLDRAHKLPRPIQMALAKGKAQISDAPYYATAEIKGTRAELIKLSIPEELGLTNIDNGKLNKDRYLTLSGVRLLYDANNIDGAFTDPFPAELLNGEWELELNGQKVFEKQPVRRFFDGFYGYNTAKPFGLYVLNNPKTINPQTPIEFNINLPTALNGFLKVFFEGTSVYSL